MPTQEDLRVSSLGACANDAPRKLAERMEFVRDSTRVRLAPEVELQGEWQEELTFEKAGPRQKIFFDPGSTTAALVTCGGLSPGLNNVIRSVYLELTHNYGVKRVLGIREGYRGLNPASGLEPIEIDADLVGNIHDEGGTVLGTSRGPQPTPVIVDTLERYRVDILFCIGGDGTQRAASKICEEIRERGARRAVVGIPKTIDNDIPYVWTSFGYATALEKAQEVLRAAHTEAVCSPNGVGLVKVMGRDAGFIAAGAAVASQDVNFVLVPEVSFPLEGDGGLLEMLERRIRDRGHAVIVVAEGAGQHLLDKRRDERDASGNLLHDDIGLFLRQRILDHFARRNIPLNLKYLDPSYLIRSVPANAWDKILCDGMARNAVHAAMARKTDVLIGFIHGVLVHVPIPAAVSTKKRLDLASDLWNAVLSGTGQPDW
jgi:6-phosphofructokinase 1